MGPGRVILSTEMIQFVDLLFQKDGISATWESGMSVWVGIFLTSMDFRQQDLVIAWKSCLPIKLQIHG